MLDFLHDTVKAVSKAKLQAGVNYDKKGDIGGFELPTAWCSPEVSIRDFIEAIMHLLFLGVAESNWELTTMWLKGGTESKLGSNPFRNNLQNLIKDL